MAQECGDKAANLTSCKSEMSNAAQEFIQLIGRCLAEKWRLEQLEAPADAPYIHIEIELGDAREKPEKPRAGQ